jgi:hypothetical protein
MLKGGRDEQEVCDNIANDDPVRIDVAVFLEQAVQVLKLSKGLGYPQLGTVRALITSVRTSRLRDMGTVLTLLTWEVRSRGCRPVGLC